MPTCTDEPRVIRCGTPEIELIKVKAVEPQVSGLGRAKPAGALGGIKADRLSPYGGTECIERFRHRVFTRSLCAYALDKWEQAD